MCCNFLTKLFSEYETIETNEEFIYHKEEYFEKAIKCLKSYENNLVLHYTTCGFIIFSEYFINWRNSLPYPLFSFIHEFEVFQTSCEIKQLFYMGRLNPDKHLLFFQLVRNYYQFNKC